MLSPNVSSPFRMTQGDKILGVHPKRTEEAATVDADHNMQIEDQEIIDHLQSTGDLPDLNLATEVNLQKVIGDYKAHLQGRVAETKHVYNSYDEMSQELSDLVEKYPDVAQKVSLGKTHEGRDIWALQVSTNVDNPEETKKKPAVVITGVHHAREWATSELPTNIAKTTLEAFAKGDPAAVARVENGELWFVPMANPDGYEYSRNENSFWRKNRRPLEKTPCGKPVRPGTYGVDLNRNYADPRPEFAHIWRPPGDDPCSTWDDGRATSDNPRKDTYRGPSGASEVEVKSLLALELGRGNVKGVLDYHSYGGMILYPWGHKREDVANVETYKAIGNKMNEALGDKTYRLMQSVSLYPTSGGSHDVHHANDIISITAEIGSSFHPNEEELGPVVERNTRLGTTFIDEILARNTGEAVA